MEKHLSHSPTHQPLQLELPLAPLTSREASAETAEPVGIPQSETSRTTDTEK